MIANLVAVFIAKQYFHQRMKRNKVLRDVNTAILILVSGLGYSLKADSTNLSADEISTLHVPLESSRPESFQPALDRLSNVDHIPDELIGDVLAIYSGAEPTSEAPAKAPQTPQDVEALKERMLALVQGINLDGEIEPLWKKMNAGALADAIRPFLQDEKTRWQVIVIPAHDGDVAKLLIPEMITALSDPNENIVSLAGEALAEVGPPAKAAIPKLLDLLSSKSDKVQFSARRALDALGPIDKQYVPLLLKLINGSDSSVSGTCSDILSKIDFDPSTQLPGLMDALNQGYDGTIIDLLIKIGPTVISPLIDHAAKKTSGTDSLDAHVSVLEHWGEQSSNALLADLHSPNDNLRYIAVSVTCDYPGKAQKDPAWLLPYLNSDPDKDIRATALTQWLKKSSDMPARLKVIKQHINDPDLQETAINAAASLNASAKPLLPLIQAVIEKVDDKSKIEYLVDYLDIDSTDDHVYSTLLGYVTNHNLDLAKQAVDALIGDDGLRVKSKSDLQKIHDDPNTPDDVKIEIEILQKEHQ